MNIVNTFRIISWALICVSLGLLGADIISSLETGYVTIRSTRRIFEILQINLPYLGNEVPQWIKAIYYAIVNNAMWVILGAFSVILGLIFRPLD